MGFKLLQSCSSSKTQSCKILRGLSFRQLGVRVSLQRSAISRQLLAFTGRRSFSPRCRQLSASEELLKRSQESEARIASVRSGVKGGRGPDCRGPQKLTTDHGRGWWSHLERSHSRPAVAGGIQAATMALRLCTSPPGLEHLGSNESNLPLDSSRRGGTTDH